MTKSTKTYVAKERDDKIMKQEFLFQKESLPIVLKPENNENSESFLIDWLEASKPTWEEMLYKYGGILFRGFEIDGLESFERIAHKVGSNLLNYDGGNSPRTKVSQKVYTSTEYPAEYNISMHNELSYCAKWPMKILFFCSIPAQKGGESPIADSREFLKHMPEDVLEKFATKKLKYIQNLHSGAGFGKSWQQTFEMNDKQQLEKYLEENDIQFEWKNKNLKTTQIREAIQVHPITKEKIWFNQADQWHPSNLDAATQKAFASFLKPHDYPLNCFYEDDTEISTEDLNLVRSIFSKIEVVFPWEKGDVLLLDNMLSAHSRRSFEGERKVYVAMA